MRAFLPSALTYASMMHTILKKEDAHAHHIEPGRKPDFRAGQGHGGPHQDRGDPYRRGGTDPAQEAGKTQGPQWKGPHREQSFQTRKGRIGPPEKTDQRLA